MQGYFAILLLALFAGVEMCTDSNASCANWVANGFCTSTFYSDAQKTQYCAASCGLCSGVSSTGSSASSSSASSSASTCVDSTSSCATWASNGFCTSTFYTPQQKAQYCAATCSLCDGSSVSSDSTTQATATTSV
uniref:ShKT domain-containing protein n=1 Tax=Caenorhabditis tropicalis TaxID=1561998 RepID=A0A1I7TNH4_9PELO